jgi:hypothetical protein
MVGAVRAALLLGHPRRRLLGFLQLVTTWASCVGGPLLDAYR